MPNLNPIFLGTSGADLVSLSTGNTAILTLNGVSSNIHGDTSVTITPDAGADSVTLGDISRAATKAVVVNLTSGGLADGASDTVTFNGGAAQEIINLSSSGAGVLKVDNFGFASTTVTGLDASDRLVFNLGGGSDIFDAHALSASNVAGAVVNGGAGDDVIIGSAANDTQDGGDGRDELTSNGGDDVLFGGVGEDKIDVNFQAGGHATVDGGAQAVAVDKLIIHAGFHAGAQADNVVVTAGGGHLLGSETSSSVDAVNVERLEIFTFSGADHIQIGDLTSVGVQTIDIDLQGDTSGISGDGQVDTVDLTSPTGSVTTAVAGADGQSLLITYAVNGVVVETVNVLNMDLNDVVTVDGVATTLGTLAHASLFAADLMA